MSQSASSADDLTLAELRELNLFICEKVMGWKVVGNEIRAENKVRLFPWWNKYLYSALPEYWTNEKLAQRILKKCMQKGAVTIEKSESGYMVSLLQSGQNYWKDFSTVAPTLELAICLFARKLFSE